MPLRLRGRALIAVFVGFFAAGVAGAGAQVAPGGFGFASLSSSAMSEALKSRHDAQTARDQLALAAPAAEDTPPPPVTDSEGEVIGFPKGFTYAFDFSSSFPYGNTGETRNGLPGGFDASLTARLDPRTNAFVQYYQIQPQILNVNSGSAPIYVVGLPKPEGSLPLPQLHLGVSSKIDVEIAGLQRLFFVGGAAINGGHPIIFAPVYAAVKGDIGGGDLNFQLQYNGGKVKYVQQRVFQQYVMNLVIPLSLTEKITALYFASPEILVHPDGFNLTNHPQFEQQLLLEYTPNKQTTIFINPSKAITYFPTDLYPVSTANFVYGISHKFKSPAKRGFLQPFVQAEVITSNPDNSQGLGVSRLTGVPGVGALPMIGGNKFTTVQLSVGSGSPPLIIPYP